MALTVPRVVTTTLIPKIASITSSETLLGYYLEAVDHPDQKFPLDKLTNVIGRDPECDIILDHPSISRRHCTIEVTPRGLLVKDLDSKNGTQVNVTLVTEAYLAVDDIISLGKFPLFIRKDTSAAK